MRSTMPSALPRRLKAIDLFVLFTPSWLLPLPRPLPPSLGFQVLAPSSSPFLCRFCMIEFEFWSCSCRVWSAILPVWAGSRCYFFGSVSRLLRCFHGRCVLAWDVYDVLGYVLRLVDTFLCRVGVNCDVMVVFVGRMLQKCWWASFSFPKFSFFDFCMYQMIRSLLEKPVKLCLLIFS